MPSGRPLYVLYKFNSVISQEITHQEAFDSYTSKLLSLHGNTFTVLLKPNKYSLRSKS